MHATSDRDDDANAAIHRNGETMPHALDAQTVREEAFASGPVREIPDVHWSRLFDQYAAQAPERVALVTESGSFTFGELESWSNRLAHALCGRGVAPGSVVACALPRSERAVVALLAVGKARGVYVPLDVDAPDSRLRTLVADARPELVISDTHRVAGLREERTVVLSRDHWRESLTGHAHTPLYGGSVGADLPAYIIYTSGTSGQPKGVVIDSGSLVNLYHEVERNFFPLVSSVDRPVRVAHGLSLAFDAAWNPFLWMFGGHELHLLPDVVRKDPELYTRTVHDRGLVVVEGTPTLLEEMVAHGLLNSRSRPDLVVVGGERVGQRLWTRLRDQTGVTALNLYGPTECTVFATWYRSDEGDEPLIGRLVANSHSRVVDDHGRIVAVGEPGELWLGGAGVADRYLNQPEMTAQRFHDDTRLGEPTRWYRTGDRCRYRPDGSLEFLGRIDDQVKVRGYRVEPGEAQNALLLQPEVRNAAVVPEERHGHTRLVAYVVLVETHDDDLVSTLRERLRAQLPEYAVPAAFVLIDRMPALPSGKVDVAALSALRTDDDRAAVEPRTEFEKSIAVVWSEVLETDHPDLHADFFEMGGHSLLAARIAARLRARGIPCSLRDVLRNPSIAALAEHLRPT